MTWTKKILLAAGIAVIGIQFIPVDRSNPDSTAAPSAPAEIQALLRRGCYDCHSNETRWPWYSRIAPVSFWLSHDVKEGRRELNFSAWSRYDERRKSRKRGEIVKQVETGEMPPWYYAFVHPEARFSAAERDALLAWAKGAQAAPPSGQTGRGKRVVFAESVQ